MEQPADGQEIDRRAVDWQVSLPKFPTASVPSEAQIKDVLAWMMDKGLIKQEVPYSQLVDASYLPK